MKTTILFLLVSLTMLSQEIPPKTLVFSHSNYGNINGMACVLYNKKFFNMKWFGIDNVNKEKRWEITEVNECNFGIPIYGFQDEINEPEEAPAEILMQLKLLKFKNPPKHPQD
jgi:hypothetical protein